MNAYTANTLQENMVHEIGTRGIGRIEIPKYITANLRHSLFDWQKSALQYLLAYHDPENEYANPNAPTHLMFNMATGSGKTLLMAACILYYYQQGYRHILFFVNRNNVIDKTESNFIDHTHAKYLFTPQIVIDERVIELHKVETFSEDPQGIEIQFTSIQKLYNDIHLQKENRTTLEELNRKNIVMLADEAHHLNADTSKHKADELIHSEITGRTRAIEVERRGWERTIIECILRKQDRQRQHTDNKHVLLEFTATIPDNKRVIEKYRDKTIYSFTLKEFLRAGYTKEVNLIATSLEKKERILHALLFQWYRHEMALKYDIANMKPVILLKSKTIAESWANYEEFLRIIETLSRADFAFLGAIQSAISTASENSSVHQQGRSRTEQILAYINSHEHKLAAAMQWIKHSYHARNVIITDSKHGTKRSDENRGKEKTDEDTERLLNSLENTNNHIRAIFTVERLTEGWDVLNLFDIVRLYGGRDEGKATSSTAGKRKVGKTTVAEKQLIGRGVRYFPFPYNDTLKNKRRFDNDVSHDLRVLEELYFYASDDHRYISELKRALRESGYIEDNKTYTTFALKEQFTQSEFYKTAAVFYNKRIDNPHKKTQTLETLKREFRFEYAVKSDRFHEEQVDFDTEQDRSRLHTPDPVQKPLKILCRNIPPHIFRKALNRKAMPDNSLFRFARLSKELGIDSVGDLQMNILADFELTIRLDNKRTREDIENCEWLQISEEFLDAVANTLKSAINPYNGSDFKRGNFEALFGRAKVKSVNTTMKGNDIVQDQEWYILDQFFGTEEEQNAIQFLQGYIDDLKEKYSNVHVLRNEEVYTIYDFDTGAGFQPDFILFLTHDENKITHYQVFIEPKGAHIATSEQEKWKQEFLTEISKRYAKENILYEENANYRLIGLPFFNSKNNRPFEDAFREHIV